MEEIQTNIFSTLEDIIFEGDKVNESMKNRISDASPLESYIIMIGEMADDIYVIARTNENKFSKDIIELLDNLYYLYNKYRIELWYRRNNIKKCEALILEYDSLTKPVYDALKELYTTELYCIESEDLSNEEYV